MTNTNEFPKKYSPKDFEGEVYKNWEEQGKFKPTKSRTGENFYIPIPPPNVTGILHLGHAIMLALEDIMTRYHRMKGDSTIWIPGTDHAGISTQAKVEEKLAKKGISKHDIGRDAFLKEAWDWKEEHANIITNQFKKMGASCDWTKERFTLDEELNKRVKKAFVDLYNKGLIYKGEYMVNYSPKLQTVVSDQEVVYKEEKGKLYYITYFVDGSDNEIVVATTRPETMLGDVAVAVHPKDKRYKKILKSGKKLILPILNKPIPLIGDEMVDMEFGTGAVKITPAHDANDFEVAKRHSLPLTEIVIDRNGIMTEKAGIFAGIDFISARQNVVELLKSKGNLYKIEDYTNRVGYCERSGCRIETIISKQWFVKIEPIVEKVIAGYKNKDFEIIPKRFNKIFEDWIFNLKDWCISRQLWWGHQIPVFYHKTTGEILVTEEDLSKNPDYVQDPDVLDTWFSSALWPFSILDYNMWGKEQPDMVKQFYPASVLETGHDIIFFWVIRMLLFGYEFTNQTPFKKIYFHGLVRDKIGRKMSKSLGNGIDPLDMIEKYGTDSLRLALTIGNTPGNDLKFDEANVENNMLFMNKLWNACRFVHANLGDEISKIGNDFTKLEKTIIDNYDSLLISEKWILSRVKYLTDLVTNSMEDYNFAESGQELQSFTKNEFCDYYIEEFKLTKNSSKYGNYVIVYVINILIKLWHPYIPFITEELHNKLGFKDSLIDSPWPKLGIKRDEEVEKEKQVIIDLIKEIRKIRAENNVIPSNTIKVQIYVRSKNLVTITDSLDIISGIVKSEETIIVDKKPKDINLAYSVIKAGIEVYVDTSNALDMDKEIERIKLSIDDTKEYIAILDKKLLNENFVRKAPSELIRQEMEKKEQAKQKLEKLEEKLKNLS
nr:valine--tRNA ligase [Candidatus Gracilibacteria bacterium]